MDASSRFPSEPPRLIGKLRDVGLQRRHERPPLEEALNRVESNNNQNACSVCCYLGESKTKKQTTGRRGEAQQSSKHTGPRICVRGRSRSRRASQGPRELSQEGTPRASGTKPNRKTTPRRRATAPMPGSERLADNRGARHPRKRSKRPQNSAEDLPAVLGPHGASAKARLYLRPVGDEQPRRRSNHILTGAY